MNLNPTCIHIIWRKTDCHCFFKSLLWGQNKITVMMMSTVVSSGSERSSSSWWTSVSALCPLLNSSSSRGNSSCRFCNRPADIQGLVTLSHVLFPALLLVHRRAANVARLTQVSLYIIVSLCRTDSWLVILIGNFVEFPSHFYDIVFLIQLMRRRSYFFQLIVFSLITRQFY